MAEEKGKGRKVGTSAMIASLAGAAVGAAVGAGAIILSDKKNRKRLEDALEGLKKQGFDVLDIVQREARTVKSRLDSARGSVKKKVKSISKTKSNGKSKSKK